MDAINIGLIGAGTVGGGVVKLLDQQRSFFTTKLKLPVRLAAIADKDPSRFAALPVGDAACVDDASKIINDSSVNIVVELIGGTGYAKKVILDALNAGKQVVTANKALVAEHGPELFDAAQKNGTSLYFEAAVGGGMPVIKTLRESLIANEIQSVKTIINGTCNYVLTQMESHPAPLDEVVKEAQKKGYAEADPTLDIGGGDAGHKVAIMASLIYGGYVPFESISIEGITEISPDDIAYADELGYRIRLLGVIERSGSGEPIDVRVHPSMLRKDHILASVSDVFNAVWLHGDAVGDMLIYGRGAGELPTASAVMGDIIDAARNIAAGTPQRIPMDFYTTANELPRKPLSDVTSRYYLRFTVNDQPGVLASIADFFAKHEISIASVLQREMFAEQGIPVIFLTHEALERNLQTALQEIEKMDYIKNATRVIRIED